MHDVCTELQTKAERRRHNRWTCTRGAAPGLRHGAAVGARGAAAGSTRLPAVRDRLVAVSLVDAHLCADPGKYLAALLLSLATMLHLELPQVNLLSKADTVAALGRLAFSLDYYTEVGPRAAPRPARPLMHDVQCGQARRRVPYTPLGMGRTARAACRQACMRCAGWAAWGRLSRAKAPAVKYVLGRVRRALPQP